MASWTNIPNANLAAGAPIRSVDTLALRDNSAYNKQNVEVELLNSQIFTSSGTWTKPTGSEYNATDTVVAMYFGAGGSGAAVRTFNAYGRPQGGNGGSLGILSFAYGTISSSLSVTIGAGGAARTASSNNQALAGLIGGQTIFNGYVMVGGNGGNAYWDGGNNAPVFSRNERKLCKSGYTGATDNGQELLLFGGLGRDGFGGNYTTLTDIGNAGGGGGGGGALYDGDSGNNVTLNNPAGISIFSLAGNGGNGSGTGNGADGSAPSGGGGACTRFNTNCISGAGGRGEMRIYVVRGKVPLDYFTGAI